MGDTWKTLRSTFTPIFTSGKMKVMLKFIKKISGHLEDDLAKKAKLGEEIDLKDSFGKFSLDGLATCAFGVDAESFTNEKSVFVKYAADLFKNLPLDFVGLFFALIPGVLWFKEIFNINVFRPQAINFFRDVILKNLEARRKSSERKNDMIDLMLDALKEEEKGQDDGIDVDLKVSHEKKIKLTDDDIVSTALVILLLLLLSFYSLSTPLLLSYKSLTIILLLSYYTPTSLILLSS